MYREGTGPRNAPQPTVIRSIEGHDWSQMLAASRSEGHRMVSRMLADFEAGTNCFNSAGEVLLAHSADGTRWPCAVSTVKKRPSLGERAESGGCTSCQTAAERAWPARWSRPWLRLRVTTTTSCRSMRVRLPPGCSLSTWASCRCPPQHHARRGGWSPLARQDHLGRDLGRSRD